MQKLTANLKSSLLYGQKTKTELKNISNQILETKISIGLLHEKLENANIQKSNLELAIKRQDEQISNYQYKKQKLQIRISQQNRKLQLQTQMLEKKSNYQNNLTSKIKIIQENIQKENAVNEQHGKIKKQMENIEIQTQKSAIQLQNLYEEVMIKNKQLRQKEDKLYFKRNSNLKKKNLLTYLNSALQAQSNKENNDQNVLQIKQMSNNAKLQKIKSSQQNKMQKKVKDLLLMYKLLDGLWQNGGECKKQISKFEQVVQQARMEKNSICKLIQENETNN